MSRIWRERAVFQITRILLISPMVDRIHISERSLAISSAPRIMPLKGRNGNLSDKRFRKKFQEEEEKKGKDDNKHIFLPSEIVESDNKAHDLIEPTDKTAEKEHPIENPDDALRRRIDILV